MAGARERGGEGAGGDVMGWMGALPPHMHSAPLSTLAIPGSHDSFGCYRDVSCVVCPEQRECVQTLPLFLGGARWRVSRRWVATQSLDVSGQLAAGVRYLDLRVSTKPHDPDNRLYFAQGLSSGAVNAGLAQISRFLASQPHEVVLLDFNQFHGLQKSHHEALVRALREAFGEKLCPVTFAEEVSLRYLWARGYQVLVFYHHPVALDVVFLWPGQMMPSVGVSTTDPDKLGISLVTALAQRHRRPGTFCVSPLVLTPKPTTIIRSMAGGLREALTQRAPPVMMEWLAAQGCGEDGVNIVTTDFVELGGFISTVISLNTRRDPHNP